MKKVPYKMFIELAHDESGLSFGKAMVRYFYYLEEDPNLSAALPVLEVQLTDDQKKQLHAIFDACGQMICDEVGAIPFADAKKKSEIRFLEVESKKLQDIDPDTLVLPQPLQSRVNERVVEIVSQKLAAKPEIQGAAAKFMQAPFVEEESLNGKIFNPTPEQKARRRKILKWVGIGVLVVGAVIGLAVIIF